MKQKGMMTGTVYPADGVKFTYEFYPETDQIFFYSENDEGNKGSATFEGIGKSVDDISAAKTEADILRILAKVFVLGHKAGYLDFADMLTGRNYQNPDSGFEFE